jgi:hypothetical protein
MERNLPQMQICSDRTHLEDDTLSSADACGEIAKPTDKSSTTFRIISN